MQENIRCSREAGRRDEYVLCVGRLFLTLLRVFQTV